MTARSSTTASITAAQPAKPGEARRDARPAAHRGQRRRLQPPLLDQPREPPEDLLQARLGRAAPGIVQHDREAALEGHLDDALAHRTCADHADRRVVPLEVDHRPFRRAQVETPRRNL